MGYSNRTDIENIIAQAMTSATGGNVDDLNNIQPLMNIGNVLDSNTIDIDIVDSYIRMADNEIDATLSQLYIVPFKEKIFFETILYSDIDDYNNYIISSDYFPISIGEQVVIIKDDIQERHIIEEIISDNVFSTEDAINYSFTSGDRLLHFGYPKPIKWISARKAAANIYDKYFASENAPNVSDFGKNLRKIATRDLNNILNGRTILHSVSRIGRRFYNPNLSEQYDLPKGNDGDKNIGDLGT